MNKIKLILILILCVNISNGQEKKGFIPSGKAHVKIFSNVHTKLAGDHNSPAFEITRGYLGYSYKFSSELSGKITLDVGNPKAGGIEHVAYLKIASVTYKKERLRVDFGMISTKYFKVSEKIWGYRYMYKSFQDKYKFGASADIGISADYKFSDLFSADLMIVNGEGYKKMQSDSVFRYGVGLTLTPIKGLTARIYGDNSEIDDKQQTIAGFLAYSTKKFNIGAEYNYQKNNAGIKDNDMYGVSLYSTVRLNNKIAIFTRYDNLNSEESWNESKDGILYMAGLEYSPTRGLKITPNYQGWDPSSSDSDFISSFYVNLEIKF